MAWLFLVIHPLLELALSLLPELCLIHYQPLVAASEPRPEAEARAPPPTERDLETAAASARRRVSQERLGSRRWPTVIVRFEGWRQVPRLDPVRAALMRTCSSDGVRPAEEKSASTPLCISLGVGWPNPPALGAPANESSESRRSHSCLSSPGRGQRS